MQYVEGTNFEEILKRSSWPFDKKLVLWGSLFVIALIVAVLCLFGDISF